MASTIDLGPEGLCGAAFVGATKLQIVTGCQDGRIRIRDRGTSESEGVEVKRVESHPIHCVAAHPQREQYAIGDKAGGVHVSFLSTAIEGTHQQTAGRAIVLVH